MASTNKVSLKLLIDKKAERVLFAEAGKDFVDFLFHIFSLPLGTVANLLTKEKMVGCLGKLYGSIEDLNNTYLNSITNKNNVLNPKTPTYASNALLLLPGNSASYTPSKHYCCSNSNSYNRCTSWSDKPGVRCSCGASMNTEAVYVSGPSVKAAVTTDEGTGGYVKGVVTYMVMDDLQVKPMSTISSVTLLNTFNVHDLRTLDEKVVYLSMDEGLELLKASLQSKTVLTDVFIGKKA